jgi:hypothetical protein
MADNKPEVRDLEPNKDAKGGHGGGGHHGKPQTGGHTQNN